jgi:hypothetical protein
MAIIKTASAILLIASIILVASMLTTLVAASPTNGQAAYWTFDNGSGSTPSHSSRNGNAATPTGAVTWARDCQIAGCVTLDEAFKGSVDGTVVYNRALPASQVRSIYQYTGGGATTTGSTTSSTTSSASSPMTPTGPATEASTWRLLGVDRNGVKARHSSFLKGERSRIT